MLGINLDNFLLQNITYLEERSIVSCMTYTVHPQKKSTF